MLKYDFSIFLNVLVFFHNRGLRQDPLPSGQKATAGSSERANGRSGMGRPVGHPLGRGQGHGHRRWQPQGEWPPAAAGRGTGGVGQGGREAER